MFPEDSLAQELGRKAAKIFINAVPHNWIVKPLDGDDDFGLDYLINLKDSKNQVKYTFLAQLKGTQDKRKLTSDKVKVRLRAKTLNYYANQGLVLLVVCDLSSGVMYYEYMHNILIKLAGNNRYLNDPTREYTISVDRSNVLNEKTDVSDVLEKYALGAFKAHRRKNIEDEHNIEQWLDHEDQNYPEQRRVNEQDYLYRHGKVSLQAFIPYGFDFDISCLITFELRDAKNCLLTPDQKTILTSLFTGYKTKPTSRLRKWFVSAFDQAFYIQIGDARLKVPADVLVDLSMILDDLYEVYCSRLRMLESKLRSRAFSASMQYREGFRLIRIKRSLWYHIQAFAHANEAHQTSGEWAIFGSDNYSLRVYLKDKKLFYSGNIIISPESDIGYTNYKTYDDEVILTWNSLPPEKYNRSDILDYVPSVEDVYDWLVNVLIPKVVYEHNQTHNHTQSNKRLWRRRRPEQFNDFLAIFSVQDYICADYRHPLFKDEGSDSKRHIYTLAVNLQAFFHNNDDVFLDAEGLMKLYEGVMLLFSDISDMDLNYIYGNLNDLPIEGVITKPKLIEAIDKKILSINESIENASIIDFILRCYVTMLRGNSERIDNETARKIMFCLNDLFDRKDCLDLKFRRLQSLS